MRFDVGRSPLGQLDDQVVAQHAAGGLIAALGLRVAPPPQLADDRQRRGRRAPSCPTRAASARATSDRSTSSSQRLHLLVEPAEPAELLQLGADLVAQRRQVADVVQGVFDLPLASRGGDANRCGSRAWAACGPGTWRSACPARPDTRPRPVRRRSARRTVAPAADRPPAGRTPPRRGRRGRSSRDPARRGPPRTASRRRSSIGSITANSSSADDLDQAQHRGR